MWSYGGRLGATSPSRPVSWYSNSSISIRPSIEWLPREQRSYAVLWRSLESSLVACPRGTGLGRQKRQECPCWDSQVLTQPHPPPHTHKSCFPPHSAVLVQPCSSLSDTVSCNVCSDVSVDASLGERRNGLRYEEGASSRALSASVVSCLEWVLKGLKLPLGG